MLKGLLVALQFITRIPVKRDLHVTDKDLANSAIFFPIVGLLIGGIQMLIFFASDLAFPSSITAFFLLIAPIILTGAFHLEGLGDMADGFLGGKNREDILRIMRDSHVGTMGMIAVVSLMLAKFIFLREILQIPNPFLIAGALLLIPSLSRWGMVIAAGVSRYARDDFGLGRAYTEGVGKKIVILSGIVPVIAAAVYFRVIGGLCIVITILSALIASWLAKRKISGVTGDVLGGINEITEAILLLNVIALSKF